MKKNKLIVYVTIIVVCLITFRAGYWAIQHFRNISNQTALTEKLHLKAVKIQPQDVTIKREYIGYVEAIHQVQIVPFISGYLQDIFISPGQTVRQGEPLVTIDDSEYKAKLDAAEATVLQEKSSFEYNKNYYDRVQKSGKKAFSEIEIDNAKNNFQQSEATLKNAEANKEFANINYNYTKINAPISGLIGNFNLSQGEYVTPSESMLLNIVQTDPIRVVFSLTNKEYLQMKDHPNDFKNTIIKLRTSDGQLYEYDGEFKYTDNKMDKKTDSLSVYAYFKNDKNKLLPNAFVTIELFKTFKDSVLIPKNLVIMKQSGNFVTIYRNDKIFTLPIKIIADTPTSFLVKNTFEKNDLLITNSDSLPSDTHF